MTWTLARACTLPDREFPAVGALAREIIAWRARLPPDPDGQPAEIELAAVTAARGGLPSGAAIAVRARLARSDGARTIERLGYVFAPAEAGQGRQSALKHLMAAILAAQPETAHA